MELEYTLLGLITLHGQVTGYELNRIIDQSTGPLLSTSLSQIYPALKRLHKRGLVSFTVQPLKNRPNKKIYQITPAGEEHLLAWLKEPVESSLDFKAFQLKMAFSPLMPKDVILGHIDDEITYRESLLDESRYDLNLETEYLDKERFDQELVELLWIPMNRVNIETEHLRNNWLKQWRTKIETGMR